MATVTERLEVPPPTVERREGGDRFVGAGLLVMAALFVSVQLLAGEVIPPLAVPTVVYVALGIVVLRRRPRWLLITVAVGVALHLASSMPFIASALTHPESVASFVPMALVGIIGLAVVAGAVAGIRGAQAARRLIILVAGGASVAALGVSLVAAAGVESDARQPGDVAVEAVRSQFPTGVQVPAGEAVVWADNQDRFHHTFVIDGTDVHEEMPALAAVRFAVDLEPGTYRYFCDVPGHERMEGELHVR